jgi:hypothetical protein
VQVKRLEEACEIAKYPVCGTARIVLKQDQALVLAPDDTGEMSAQLLTVKQRLEVRIVCFGEKTTSRECVAM